MPSECLISCLWGDLSACNVFSCPGGEPESPAVLTPEQMEQLRLDKIKEKKLHIAGLGSAIVADPYSNVKPRSPLRSHTSLLHHRCVCVVIDAFLCVYVQVKRVKELRGMMMEVEPCVAVTVRKLVMVSLMEIFKDISPTYRIRPLTSEEKSAKVTGSETGS